MPATTASHRLPTPRRTDVAAPQAATAWPFAALTAQQRDDARNTLARAAGRHASRRFTGAAVTGFGALA